MDEPTQEQIMLWAEQKEKSKKKRWQNHENAKRIFAGKGIEFVMLSESSSHFRIGDWDFWGTTGKFWNRKTQAKGRGVFELIKLL